MSPVCGSVTVGLFAELGFCHASRLNFIFDFDILLNTFVFVVVTLFQADLEKVATLFTEAMGLLLVFFPRAAFRLSRLFFLLINLLCLSLFLFDMSDT
jgi:hypothetical protein